MAHKTSPNTEVGRLRPCRGTLMLRFSRSAARDLLKAGVMAKFNPLLWPRLPAIWSYWVAGVAVAAALIVSRWPILHLQSAPVSLFLCAVIMSAWFGGAWPGLFATALSALAFYYYFLPPIYSFGAKPEEIPRFAIFMVSALFVGLLTVAQRNATESLRHSRDELKVTVQELQRTNEVLQAASRERDRAAESLRRSEGYLAEAQRLAHMGSWVWRVEGKKALHLSDEWYRIYGFDPEKGPPAWEERAQCVHPEDRAKWTATIDRAIAEASDYHVEFRILLPDGTLRYIQTVGHPVLDASRNLVEFLGTSMDVTDRRLGEESLRQTQADLARVSRVTTMGELTASLAHEVNQPIAAASTNANTCLRWLAADPPNIEEARAAAARIANDTRRAGEIVSRVRQLFKKGMPQRELADVNDIIREMIVLLRGEISRYNIFVGNELAKDIPPILADRVQLQQVLMNLVINGIEAMKDIDGRRELTIKSLRTPHEEIVVSVSDSGVGLPAQQTEQIFNPFFTTKPHGTGMGLRISRSIIESHGGRLWAADNTPQGAIFYFTLPTNAEAPE
jgi:signal transduction histidine kinase